MSWRWVVFRTSERSFVPLFSLSNLQWRNETTAIHTRVSEYKWIYWGKSSATRKRAHKFLSIIRICSSKYKIFIIKSLAHTYTHIYLGQKRSHYNDNTWELWWNEVDIQQKCVVWISKMLVFSYAGFLGPDGSGTVAALLIWMSYTNVWVRLWFADSRIRCWLNYHPKYVSEFPSTFPKMLPRYAKQVSQVSTAIHFRI